MQRTPAEILHAFRVNLEWSRAAAALRLTRLRQGTSAWKTQAGLLRGLQQSLDLLNSEERRT